MVAVTVKVLTAASSFDLLSLAEAKAALGIASGDVTGDAVLTEQIARWSSVVSAMCDRTFASENVRETWRDIGNRQVFYLGHFPVAEADIDSVTAGGATVAPADYELEESSGRITFFASCADPVVITYTGGYDLPSGAPPALKQVAELLIRDDRRSSARSSVTGAGIKSIFHKESRVYYFDGSESQGSSSGSNTGGSVTSPSVSTLLHLFARLHV